jgi:hypothetical protein
MAVSDFAAERLGRPERPFGRYDVQVVQQDHGPSRPVAAQPGIDAPAPGLGLEGAGFDAGAVEDGPQELRRLGLVPRRIGRVDGEILREQRDGLVPKRQCQDQGADSGGMSTHADQDLPGSLGASGRVLGQGETMGTSSCCLPPNAIRAPRRSSPTPR